MTEQDQGGFRSSLHRCSRRLLPRATRTDSSAITCPRSPVKPVTELRARPKRPQNRTGFPRTKIDQCSLCRITDGRKFAL